MTVALKSRGLRAAGAMLAAMLTLQGVPALSGDRDDCSSDDHEKAIPACTRLISSRKTPKADLPTFYYNRATSYIANSEYDAAITDLDKAIELKSDYAEAYVSRGIAYDYKKDFDAALRDYTAVSYTHLTLPTNREV